MPAPGIRIRPSKPTPDADQAAAIKRRPTMVEDAVECQVDQSLRFRVVLPDRGGNPAKPVGAVLVTLTKPDMGKLKPDADGLGGEFRPGNQLGRVEIIAKADLIEGTSIASVSASLPVDIVAGLPVAVRIKPKELRS